MLLKACVGLAVGALILSACASTAAPSNKAPEPSRTGRTLSSMTGWNGAIVYRLDTKGVVTLFAGRSS
jgi:hypothetical protein